MAASASATAPGVTAIDPAMVISHKFPEVTFGYDERLPPPTTCSTECSDEEDEKELQLVYSRDGASSIKVLPTFVSSFIFKSGNGLCLDVPGLNYDPKLLLHGQHYIEIYRPIPSRANVTNKIKVAGLHDRGKAAVLELEILTCPEGSDDVLCMNRSTIYLRGAGGFSDSSQTFSYATYAANEVSNATFPDSTPSAVYEDRTQNSQALLCGLSGYLDPLHSDPTFAHAAGFSHPILPGLSTLGFAVRAVMRSFCSMEAAAVRLISCRFLHQVYPGETLVTEMWLQEQSRRVYFRTKVKERGRAVLSGHSSVVSRKETAATSSISLKSKKKKGTATSFSCRFSTSHCPVVYEPPTLWRSEPQICDCEFVTKSCVGMHASIPRAAILSVSSLVVAVSLSFVMKIVSFTGVPFLRCLLV